ncbi:Isoamylase 3, chloroplastic [Sesbania bispinosa]|nr:Isoamylase 3, chloroplastic [Sesbania bispinosa]
MGKQTKPRKPDSFGKGKVPKSLLSLSEMLDEYICLKEQKVMMDQERVILEQEKNRVQMLLQGMQNVMNTYNASRSLPASTVPVMNTKSAVVPQPKLDNRIPPGVATTTTATPSTQNTSNIHSLPQSVNTNVETGNLSTPTMSVSDRKRRDTKAMDAPSVAKKSRSRSSSRNIPVQGQNTLPKSNDAANNQIISQSSSATQSSAGNCILSGPQVQGTSVAKCLFNQPSLSIPTNSPVPKTPPRTNSCNSDTNITPPEISSVATCNEEATPASYTVISTKRVMVSPAKKMAYIESSHCISPVKTDSDKVSKRDHVRSRLDFDASDMPESSDKSLPNEVSASESDKEVDLFDIDFPDLDALGIDFSFTEMLSELEIPYEGIDFPCRPTSSHSKDNASGPSHECKANQAISELSSTTPEALSEKDMNMQGPDCLTAMKSVTKCIKILSPACLIIRAKAKMMKPLVIVDKFLPCSGLLEIEKINSLQLKSKTSLSNIYSGSSIVKQLNLYGKEVRQRITCEESIF